MLSDLVEVEERVVPEGYQQSPTLEADQARIAEAAKTDPNLELGTFSLPMTENPDDRKVRVNTDLALWIPEASAHHEESKELIRYLMQPDVQHP